MTTRRVLNAAATLAAPRVGRAQAARILRHIPQVGLTTLDGVADTQLVARDASLLVFDTLFGTGSRPESGPQMCQAYERRGAGAPGARALAAGVRCYGGNDRPRRHEDPAMTYAQARHGGCQEPGALGCELDCWLAETEASVEHCGPDLEHAVGAQG